MIKTLALTVLAATSIYGIVGCGTSNTAVVQASPQAKDAMDKMRALFDKSGGDWSSLSPADQATYNQLAGGAGSGQENWKLMSKNKPGSKAPVGQNTDPRTQVGAH